MKKVLLAIITITILFGQNSFGQIYIDTGNPELETIKQDNPDTKIYNNDTKPAYNESTSTTSKSNTIYVPASKGNTEPVATKSISTSSTSAAVSKKMPINTTSGASTGYSGNLSAANDELPPFAEPGKCYARCFISDQFEFYETEVVDKATSYRLQVIPATFETVFDTIVVSSEKIRVEVVPAVYETVYEDIMIAPATTRWERGTGDAACLSNDPKDCQVICLKEVPAQFNKVERKVVKTPSFTRQITTPAEIKIVPRKVMVKPAENLQIEIPATYKKVMEKRLVKKGGYTDWREVLCASKLTNDRIRQIQNALVAKGYSVGDTGADNVFGEATKTALKKFQADNNLPQGNLNMETLNALGVK